MEKAAEINGYNFTKVDFDHPSKLFLLEDIVKGYLGCLLLYNPYIKSFRLQGNENILDFGCGGGTGSKCLLKHLNEDGHLTCIDSSRYWINKAKKRLNKHSNVECLFGNIKELNIPDSSYDVITIMHVLHDIEPEDRQDTVNELSQKLKKHGSIFVREPIKKSHGMAVEEIQTIFTSANFQEVENEKNKKEFWGKFVKYEN
jgi:ubiquinone/menaquinone biosynthesis C-methylase UbiE